MSNMRYSLLKPCKLNFRSQNFSIIFKAFGHFLFSFCNCFLIRNCSKILFTPQLIFNNAFSCSFPTVILIGIPIRSASLNLTPGRSSLSSSSTSMPFLPAGYISFRPAPSEHCRWYLPVLQLHDMVQWI